MRSDAELVATAMGGGPEAFGPIIERYRDAVFGVALARLRNFHDAEDVAQQVFVEAFERLGNLGDPSRLGAWLRSITIHRSIDFLRRRQRDADIEQMDEPASDALTPRSHMERRELRDQVMAAIARLSKTQRETTTLFYINGYSIEEVAAIQEAPVGTVKRRLHDAREKLKEEMLGMVESVLKSEAPKEDFAQRVFDLLSRFRPRGDEKEVPWQELVAELRKIGSRGIEGFIKALDSPHSPTRAIAAGMVQMCDAPETKEVVIGLLKNALNDANKVVRRAAVEALLKVDVSAERTQKEFVPLIVPRLGDASKRVRRAAAWSLRHWAPSVPLDSAARALVEEKDRETAIRMTCLVRAILDAQGSGRDKT